MQHTQSGVSIDALRVAQHARLYALAARRPEFLNTDGRVRFEAAWTEDAPGPLALVDRVLIARMDELDRICAYAVRRLAQGPARGALDVLGVLDGWRVAAMYYALPEQRRQAVLRADGAWNYHVAQFDQAEVEDAYRFWDDMPDLPGPVEFAPAEQQRYGRFVREAERSRLGLAVR